VSRLDAANLAATVVGAVFVYAGVAKALSGREWPRAAARLGVPRVIAYTVMLAEVVLGLGMVLGDSLRDGFLVAGAALLVAFTALLAKHLRSGHRPPCACFGGSSQRPIGMRDVVRNVSLLVVLVFAIVS
jgi:uncharacterized membrane protein YphA (DoxX/SURF4 family)